MSNNIRVGPQAATVIRPTERSLVGPSSSLTVVPNVARPLLVVPQASLLVEPRQRPAWDAKGWVPQPHNGRLAYEGFYEVTAKRTGEPLRFRGRLMETGRTIATYIADPPAEIKRHPKGKCFSLTDTPWFRVHWQEEPRNVDEAILYVETVLDEAINRYGG